MRRLLLLIAFFAAVAGCTAELKEENNSLLRALEVQEREIAAVVTENGELKLRLADLEAQQKRADLAVSLGMRPGEDLWALLETSRGEVLCELLPASAPLTVANFVQLVEGKKPWQDQETKQMITGTPYYDGTLFHRVIPEFMIQGGDRSGTGRGTPGFLIPDEFDPKLKHLAGTISMANTGAPNSGGSQFFITDVAAPQLDGKYSAFGSCEPLSLIREIARAPRDENDRPLESILLRRATVHRGARPL